MSKVQFDQIAPVAEFDRLPIRFIGTASRGAAIARLLLVLPAMAGLIVPLFLLVAHAGTETSAYALLSERPLSTLQIGVGFLIWGALFLVPLRAIVARLGASRSVAIDPDLVRVTDKTPFGSTAWSVPLASYSGIAHHVRASLSGLRHELILVHPDPAKNLLVAVADRIPQATLDRAKALLRLPEVPAKSLYMRGGDVTTKADAPPASTGLPMARAA